jgi:hypothetical protein
MKLGLLLIALAMGYRVYADASKEKGSLRSLGQWVGAIVMATSLLASALFVYSWGTGKGNCFEKGLCPFKGKMQMGEIVPAK